MVGKSRQREIATLAIIQISNLETRRYGPKSGDSRIIRESSQPRVNNGIVINIVIIIIIVIVNVILLLTIIIINIII